MYPDILQAGLQPNAAAEMGPGSQHANGRARAAATGKPRPSDTHLRSVNNVMRYYVHANDGDIGHVQGLLIEEKTWAVRYFIVNTSNWWLGHAVLISPEWIDDVFWAESKLVVSMSRQAVKDAPAYSEDMLLDRDQEESLAAHYSRVGYWSLETGGERSPGHEQPDRGAGGC